MSKKVKADKYGILRFENNKYSMLPKFAETEIWLKIEVAEIEVLNED